MKIDNLFPNRHVDEHGKYDDSIFTEENSINLSLLPDTIHYVMSKSGSLFLIFSINLLS
jgi:hypothetical protein